MMKIVNVVAFVLLGAVSAANTAYLVRLRGEASELSHRIKALSLELANVKQASRPQASAAMPLVFTTGIAAAHPAAAATDERVRELVAQELTTRQAAEKATLDAHLEVVAQQARDTVTTALGLNDAELDSLDQLSRELAAADEALVGQRDSGALSEPDARAQYQQVWQRTDASLRRLLGDSRYAKATSLRSEHPELGRSFAVLRGAPMHAQEIAGNNR